MTLLDAFQVQALRAHGGRSRFVRTIVGRMHVIDVIGQGALPPVLLLHGITSSAADWYPLIRRIRRSVRAIVAVDMPGHGMSQVPTQGLTAEALHRGLLHTLMHVGEEPMVVVGSSMGGMAAVRWASVRPEKVRGLVLLSPGGAPADHLALRKLLGHFDLRDPADARSFIDKAFHAGHPLRPLMAMGVRERALRRHMRQLIADIGPEHLLHPSELRDLRCPVLLSWGQDEAILPPEHLDFWRAHLPPELTTVERPAGHGHVPFVTHPDQTADRLMQFLAQLPDGKVAA